MKRLVILQKARCAFVDQGVTLKIFLHKCHLVIKPLKMQGVVTRNIIAVFVL